MRKLYLLLVLIVILLVSSCSAEESKDAENAADGLSFNYFKTYEIAGTNYDVYLPSEIELCLYYKNELGNISSQSSDWTVNFIYEATYHLDESREKQEVWSELYRKLLSDESILEEKCGFDVTLFDPYESTVLEYSLHNESKEEATYVIFNTYLPIRLVNNSTRKTSTVGIPIDMKLLLKIGNSVENPFEDGMMSWEDFLAI